MARKGRVVAGMRQRVRSTAGKGAVQGRDPGQEVDCGREFQVRESRQADGSQRRVVPRVESAPVTTMWFPDPLSQVTECVRGCCEGIVNEPKQ